MKRMNKLIAAALMAIVFISCETKVDLIDEGKEQAVVYGFIDPTQDTQFVKITHTFLTEGSAIEGAQDPSLSQYQDLEAYVTAFSNNDSVDSFLLNEKVVTTKDSGAFYYPVQTVYYFAEPINDDYTYGLNFFGSGSPVASNTSVVGFKQDNSMIVPNISLVTSFDLNTYGQKMISMSSNKNTRRYECTFRFHFTEIYTDGTEAEKQFDITLSPFITDRLNGGESNSFILTGEEFYSRLGGKIRSQNNEENVERRIIGTMEYIFNYGGDELQTFIELSEPSSSINVEQNPFSNIENGIGLFSSRGQTNYPDKKFDLNSVKEFALGPYTGELKFCSADPAHNGLTYGCN